VGNGKMTITDAAARLRITPKTIIRWEKAGKVQRAKRDWRGWRIYDKNDFKRLRDFKETIIFLDGEVENENGNI